MFFHKNVLLLILSAQLSEYYRDINFVVNIAIDSSYYFQNTLQLKLRLIGGYLY